MAYVIYKIHCNITGDDYYGSTMNYKSRMKGHKTTQCSSHHIIARNNYVMIVVEKCEENTKTYALTRERFYIENNPCINIRTPIKSKEENLATTRVRKLRRYYCDLCCTEQLWANKSRHTSVCINKLIILPPTDEEELATQTARKINTASVLKAYVVANADKVKAYKDLWYQQNKDKISEQGKIARANPVMFECECGKTIAQKSKTTHMRSKYHLSRV